MKLVTILFVSLIALTASAAEPTFSLQAVSFGTNAIPAGSAITFPLTLATTITTNPGTQNVYKYATNSATNTVKFTIPTTNTLSFTNTFIESNYVVGVSSKTWTVAEAVRFTNNAAYYVTNAAYITVTNSSGTNIYTTNSATIRTNYQVIATSAVVPFTITGTDYTTITNVTKGNSAIDVTESQTAAVKIAFNLTGAGTSSVTFYYIPTLDGVVDNAVVSNSIVVIANGTNTVSTNLSLTVGSLGYLNFTMATNANANALTNLSFKYAQKIAAP